MSEASNIPLKTTPLHALHVRLGGRMVEFGGYDMPVQYPEGIMAEHNWTRTHAGLFGVLSGLTLVGMTTSGDANIALRYTLLSIAGVILGGGEFIGGRVSPIGAVIGALVL